MRKLSPASELKTLLKAKSSALIHSRLHGLFLEQVSQPLSIPIRTVLSLSPRPINLVNHSLRTEYLW
jgi:hypothetical protein